MEGYGETIVSDQKGRRFVSLDPQLTMFPIYEKLTSATA